ncbi:MAG: hypothetical protein WC365_01115 [Candidatus Babeliales bacterium]|jgi:hypothetical protein
MAPTDILKQNHYGIGDLVLVGQRLDCSFPCRITSIEDDDGNYIMEFNGALVRISGREILGKVLTLQEKYNNLSFHMTKVLTDLQKCIKEKEELREDRDAAIKHSIELEVQNEMLEKHCSRMIKHILDFYCKRT